MRYRCYHFFLLCSLGACGVAGGDIATFDSFTEGYATTVLEDGGVRLMNLDRRLAGDPVPAMFMIEDANNMLWREAGFSPRNAVGFGAYAPGVPVTFGRLGSLEIEPRRLSSRISVQVFEYGNFAGRTINLETVRDGARVGFVSVPLVNTYNLHAYTLELDGAVFDRARLSIGPAATDYNFALLDTVATEVACPADWNNSGTLDSADFFDFLSAFFAAEADYNADGATDSRDFFAFLSGFFAGC